MPTATVDPAADLAAAVDRLTTTLATADHLRTQTGTWLGCGHFTTAHLAPGQRVVCHGAHPTGRCVNTYARKD